MRTIYLRAGFRRWRGFSPVIALIIIAVLVLAVFLGKRYMKATAKDPDLCYDLKPWKEWRLREASEKPIPEISAEQPALTEGLKFDTNLKDIRPRHDPATAVGQYAERLGKGVQAKDDLRRRVAQYPFFDHELRTAFLSFWRPFFGRLKDKLHAARQVFFHPAQHFCHPHQDRRMGVMTAGVHNTYLVTVVESTHL